MELMAMSILGIVFVIQCVLLCWLVVKYREQAQDVVRAVTEVSQEAFAHIKASSLIDKVDADERKSISTLRLEALRDTTEKESKMHEELVDSMRPAERIVRDINGNEIDLNDYDIMD